jgi:hypothetical protein
MCQKVHRAHHSSLSNNPMHRTREKATRTDGCAPRKPQLAPHNALAFGERVFPTWSGLAIMREVVALMTSWQPQDGTHSLAVAPGVTVLSEIFILLS